MDDILVAAPVSYTHLDVYKRQVQHIGAAGKVHPDQVVHRLPEEAGARHSGHAHFPDHPLTEMCIRDRNGIHEPCKAWRTGTAAAAGERKQERSSKQCCGNTEELFQGDDLIPVSYTHLEVMALADGAGSALGTGGMATKLRAARMVTGSGADMVIANGAHPELLYDIAAGRSAGTRFAARKED